MVFDPQSIISIHAELSKEHKIEPGFKDKNLIDSICAKSFAEIHGQELYPTVYLKASAIFEGIIRFHPFVDGNKRTALASCQEFRFENDLIFIIPLSAVRFAVKVAQKTELNQDDIESLTMNVSNWVKFRTVRFLELRGLMRIIRIDDKLLKKIKKISKKQNKPSLPDQVLDYWLAKDIYPETDITYEEMVNFQNERMERVIAFLKSRTKSQQR